MATMGPGKNCDGQLNLADDCLAQGPGLNQHGRIDGNARAHHDQILPAKGTLAVAAGFDGDAVIEQQRDFCAEAGRSLAVGNRDARATRLQK